LILVRPIAPRFPTIIGRLLKTFPSVFASGTKFSSFSQSTAFAESTTIAESAAITESATIADSAPVTEPTAITESATIAESAAIAQSTTITQSAKRHAGTYPTDSRKAQVSIVRRQLAWTLPRGQVRSAVAPGLGIKI
jgi:hypothetical protein